MFRNRSRTDVKRLRRCLASAKYNHLRDALPDEPSVGGNFATRKPPPPPPLQGATAGAIIGGGATPLGDPSDAIGLAESARCFASDDIPNLHSQGLAYERERMHHAGLVAFHASLGGQVDHILENQQYEGGQFHQNREQKQDTIKYKI